MKFQHLPVGARFEFEGRRYTKTGPMTASGDDGGQRMIPRWAVPRLLDGGAAPAAHRPGRYLDAGRVEAAFQAFHQESLALLREYVDEPRRAAVLERLEAARQRFLAELA